MSTFKLVCTVQPPGNTAQDCPTQSLMWVQDSPPWWSLTVQQGADLASAIVGCGRWPTPHDSCSKPFVIATLRKKEEIMLKKLHQSRSSLWSPSCSWCHHADADAGGLRAKQR